MVWGSYKLLDSLKTKTNFNTILLYFSLNVTLKILRCIFMCSNMLCSSIVIRITQIQLFTTSLMWDIQWKPYIDIFPRRPPCIYTNMADRGEKLQELHCYHPFSDSRDIYLTKITMRIIHHRWYRPTPLAHGLWVSSCTIVPDLVIIHW